MAVNKRRIEELLIPPIEAAGAHLIEFSIRGERASTLVEVFVDTDKGVTADECAEISRRISPILEDVEELQGRYNLVVSSPGLERPLKFPKQFERNIGRKISITRKGVEGKGKVEGDLAEVRADSIVVKIGGNAVTEIPFGDISEALILPRW